MKPIALLPLYSSVQTQITIVVVMISVRAQQMGMPLTVMDALWCSTVPACKATGRSSHKEYLDCVGCIAEEFF
jgi:hypothetical protein